MAFLDEFEKIETHEMKLTAEDEYMFYLKAQLDHFSAVPEKMEQDI